MRDDPNIRLRCSINVRNTGFTDEKHEADNDLPPPPPLPRVSTQHVPRVYVQNVPVYAGITRTCINHVDVLPVYTGTL